ncbi:MAG: tyrosine-type recombinase/integrase, partial [Planctomycetaceae bacterium]
MDEGACYAEVGMLTIRRSLAQLKGKFVLKEPKSKRSRRTIKLPAFVVKAFYNHRDGMVKEGNTEKPVFCTQFGSYIGKSNLTRQVFRPALKTAGLPLVRFHGLRHSHASALLRDGASGLSQRGRTSADSFSSDAEAVGDAEVLLMQRFASASRAALAAQSVRAV